MKKVLFFIKRSENIFEISVNKQKPLKRVKNLGRCLIFISQYIVESRIQNYELYAFERGRHIAIKDFNADNIYDFSKDKKDSILSFGEYENEKDDELDFNNDEEDDNFSYSRNYEKQHNNTQYKKKYKYNYTPKDNSHTLEIIKDNIKNLLG